jgi:hypothetical protein
MLGWHTGGMGPIGWLLMGAFWLTLVAVVLWLVIRLLPGSSAVTTRAAEKGRDSAAASSDHRHQDRGHG